MIYFAFVNSHLLYGVEVYANTTTNHLSKLITLNNKLLRVLQDVIKTYNSKLYKTYFTLPLKLLHNFQILLFIQKYVHHRSELPAVFSTYFEENLLLHCRDTRQKTTSTRMLCSLKLEKKTVKYRGSKLWNNLPDDLKNTTSLLSFKYRLKSYLLHTIE